MVNKKAAPRQPILRIDKTGPWGRIEYVHVLACGHQEVRKRASRAPVIACAGCLLAESHVAQVTALINQPQSTNLNNADFDDWLDYDAEEVALEVLTGRLKAKIASSLNLNAEDVEIRVELTLENRLEVQAALVHLSPDVVKRLGAD